MSHFNGSKLKSWFMATVAFGIGAILIDFIWTHLVITGNAASDSARISHLIREHGSEIPIFGTSKAQDDYLPEILGDDVFNYGMPGASLDETVALMQIECKKQKQTPIVLDLAHQGLITTSKRAASVSQPEILAGKAELATMAPMKYVPFVRHPEIRQMMDRLGLMER